MTQPLVPELICSDIERSLKFYTEVLGFTVLFARPEERFAYLEREGAQLMIEEKWYRREHVLDGSRQFIVQDPDGYLLRFSQDLGSKPVTS